MQNILIGVMKTADLHNQRNPRVYLIGTSWKSVILEPHLKKQDMEDCEYYKSLNNMDIKMLEYAMGSKA